MELVKQRRSNAFKIAIPLLLLSLTFTFAAGGAASRSTREGVFTKAQADRGKAVYNETCGKCHGETLGGGEGAPPLSGAEFIQKWQGKTVGALFEVTRSTMPADDPGNLSRREYAAVTAFMLSANELPAGDKELEPVADAMSEIKIESKK